MTNIKSRLLQFLSTFLLIYFLTGCIGGTSQRAVYYVLTPSLAPSTLQAPAFINDIGVGPVKLPGFFARPEIVTRQGETHLVVNEFHRWGDSLETQITFVLAENISAQLDLLNVLIYPWERSFEPQYQLYIDFRRFDGNPGGSFTLKAIWWVVETADDKRLITQQSSIVVPAGNDTFESYVVAQNIALEKLSLEIAEAFIANFNK